jgi:hypothetical protein
LPISVIRLYTLGKVAKSNDLSFDNTAHATLSAIEVNIGIICACLPAMRPVFALILPKCFSSTMQYTKYPVELDIEQSSALKHVRTASTSVESRIFRIHMAETNTPQANTPRLPQPTLSCTPSSRFIFDHSRTFPPTQTISPFQAGRSRSGSNISIEIARADARTKPALFHGLINPLRLSLVTPFHPQLYSLQIHGSGSYSLHPHNAAGILTDTSSATKPLPLTPLPDAVGG